MTNEDFSRIREVLNLLKDAEGLTDERARKKITEHILGLLPTEPKEGLQNIPVPPDYQLTKKIENGRSITSFEPRIVEPTMVPPEKPPVYVLPAQEQRVRSSKKETREGSAASQILGLLENFPEGIFGSELDELIEDPRIKGRATRILSDAFSGGLCRRSRGRVIGVDVSGRRVPMYRYFPIDSQGGVKK